MVRDLVKFSFPEREEINQRLFREAEIRARSIGEFKVGFCWLGDCFFADRKIVKRKSADFSAEIIFSRRSQMSRSQSIQMETVELEVPNALASACLHSEEAEDFSFDVYVFE